MSKMLATWEQKRRKVILIMMASQHRPEATFWTSFKWLVWPFLLDNKIGGCKSWLYQIIHGFKVCILYFDSGRSTGLTNLNMASLLDVLHDALVCGQLEGILSCIKKFIISSAIVLVIN